MHPSIKNSINKTRVLQEIRKEKGISRIEISSALNLDKSTISKITSDLLEQGLVIDKKNDEELKHAGRRRIGLTLNENYGAIIGIEIQTEYYNVVVINLYGEILSKYKELLPDGDFIETLDKTLNTVIESNKQNFTRILAIGIGFPGHINPFEGIIIQSNPLNINSPLNLYKHLEDKYNYPIFIENDANCCSWGELTFSRGKRDNNFLIALGESRWVDRASKNQRNIVVGLGIVIDGKVLIGDNFSAGEFKTINWNGSPLSQFSPENSKTKDIITELSKHIALFINTFNFTKVIFAGVFTEFQSEIKEELSNQIINNWGYTNKKNIDIEFTPFGDFDVSYGAAGMIVEKFFTTPDITSTGNRYSLKGIDLLNYVIN